MNMKVSKRFSPSSYRKVASLFTAIIILIVSLVQPQMPASADALLTVNPITWNIVGLDSNNVNVGPNDFPVGMQVCNTTGGALTGITATLSWTSANANINIRPGSSSSLTLASLSAVSPGNCADFYFEVEVTRTAAAFNTARRYVVNVTATDSTLASISGASPTPREIYVEHLISQSRNGINTIKMSTTGEAGSFTSYGSGSTLNLMVGNTYWIMLDGFTATNGYNQLESFINLPNTIFQVLSVASTYTAGPPSTTSLYADSCTWDSIPISPTYKSCIGSDNKAGGDVTVTYKVKILSAPANPLANPEPISTLLYDFSGSSFHYNSDYSTSARFANIISPGIAKTFAPKNIKPGDTSVLTFTITNPGTVALTGVNFTDSFPSGMTTANTATTTSGCSAPTTPVLVAPIGCGSFAAAQTSAGFSNISIAANGTCTITINITATGTGTYSNTTNDLFVNLTTDTGSKGSDSLVVSSMPAPPSGCGAGAVSLVTWTIPTNTGLAAPAGPAYATPPGLTSGVVFANARANYTAAHGSENTTFNGVGIAPDYSWGIVDAWPSTTTAPGVAATVPYFEFSVDTSNFGSAAISFKGDLEGSGDWGSATNHIYIYSSTNGTDFTLVNTSSISKGSWQPAGTTYFTGAASTTGLGTTWFRITADNRSTNKTTSTVYLDNISITGCARPVTPTLAKSFSPASVPVDILDSPETTVNYSTLTFTMGNPNPGALTGVAFTDTLPAGLAIATPNGLTTPSTSCIAGQTITAAAGSSSITLTGGTLAASASNCTFSVRVQGTAAWAHTNVSSGITSTYTGPNSSSGGYGTSTLTVVAPPVINKAFGSAVIYTGSATSLTFTITNPNPATALTGVTFTDTLPSGLVVATPSGLAPTTCGTGTVTAAAGSSSVSLSAASIAGGASCTFSLNVLGFTVGNKDNSVAVTSTNGGSGNTSLASLTVKVHTPGLTLLKQVGPTANGPWSFYLTRLAGESVYYRLSVENTGDVAFDTFSVADAKVSTAGCAWQTTNTSPSTLPGLPVAARTVDPVATCILGPFTAPNSPGTVYPNTAQATGSASGYTAALSNESTASYSIKSPTAVDLLEFKAQPVNRGTLQVQWTVVESSTLGYNLYRRQSAGDPWVRLNGADLILSQEPGSTLPQTYTFTDAGTQPGVEYTYRLEEVNTGLQPADFGMLIVKYYYAYAPMLSQTGP